jgi:predicted PurR-regulated permease PerM
MAATEQRLALQLPWATLLKVLLAVALVWMWRELAWLLMLTTIAIIIAVGLEPAVVALERRGLPRWLAAAVLVLLCVGAIGGFLTLTWSSLYAQGQNLSANLRDIEREFELRAPTPIVDILHRSRGGADASMLASWAVAIGSGVLWAAGTFTLAWILVVYLLIEADTTYKWVRGFVPARLRTRFDQTAIEARAAAHGYVVGNVVTSICAAVYVFVWLEALHVPGALLLAVMAFVFDFVPVLGFFFSCGPAMVMAATQSAGLALLMVPIYLAYHFVENYLIAPRVYGSRLQLSNVAVLLAFAVGAELGGVAGALLALPIAAIYPAIERLWLREPFGEDVVREHNRLTG